MESPRRRAQRPFPSMMIATVLATSGRSPSWIGLTRTSLRLRERRFIAARVPAPCPPDGAASAFRRLDLHDLRLFVLQEVVDLVHVVVGHLLHLPLGRPLLVVAHLAVPHQILEVPHHVPADV